MLSRHSLALATFMALSGCKQASEQATAPTTPTPAAAATAAAPALDINELDRAADACQDLNAFANGKALAKGIPDDEVGIGTSYDVYNASYRDQHAIAEALLKTQPASGSVEQLVRTFYASGMDEAGIERLGAAPIQPRLAAIDALKDAGDIAGFITQRHAEGANVLFQFVAQPDAQSVSKMVGYALVDGMTLPAKNYYVDAQYAPIRKAYLAYIQRTFVLAGVPAEQAAVQAGQVLQLESRLAAALLTPAEQREPKNMYHWLTTAQANALTPHFAWDRFMAAQGVTGESGLALSQLAFFKAFDAQLQRAPVAQWKAYLRFRTIDDAAPALSKPFAQNHFAFHSTTLEGRQVQQPRWKQVITTLNQTIAEAMGQLYVAQKFPPASKQQVLALVENVRAAMKLRIAHADWMSAATKAKALDKLANMMPKIGYPDTWRAWSGLQLDTGTYLQNIERAAAFNHRAEMAKVGKPVDRKSWGDVAPQTVNAFYAPRENSIYFPAVILQPPLFAATADDGLNYGGIGGFIGHEISHGFDDEGSQFDAIGANRNWWLPADRAAFEARTGKIKQLVSRYVPLKSRPDLHVNGQLVLGESIADFTGVTIAYDALMLDLQQHPERNVAVDGYTPEQRFFINWARLYRNARREEVQVKALNADPHPPSVVRVNAGPSNMPQYAKAFSCKAGDAMVRSDQERAQVW
ncbi:M13 family metallopeptidase [Xanthomonas euroxanthea]|uniref:Metallopeptidase n=1 Tax=Xanthomonas euroxanthea TaxID=2259622 RepID=A0AA46C4M6_9XANT|nr:M13 family metallopeptidase [Xanthomonas euroxanthea]CAE1132337.1 M13 family metallopeptidase [Xanthomonas euroxanthea]SUZ26303.1 metallopeptidase [Xanthomonas euroxanthea]